MFGSTGFTGAGFEPDVVGYGDLHTAFFRTFDDRRRMLVNVGGVGDPLDFPLARYALLEGAAGDGAAPLTLAFVRVPDGIEHAIADAAARGMPDREPYAREPRTARYRHLP